MGFQVNTCSGTCFLLWTVRKLPAAASARRGARFGSFVVSTIGKLPCWPGNSGEPSAVTDWISKLTWFLVFVSLLCSMQDFPFARARRGARAGSAVFSKIEKWPCWPGNSIEPLTVTDWMFKLTWILVYLSITCHNQLPTRARRGARACVGSSVLSTVEESPCWLGNSNEALGCDRLDFKVNVGSGVWFLR